MSKAIRLSSLPKSLALFKMPSNTAIWLIEAKKKPLEVKSAPYTRPRDHEIVVKNAAIAINPLDWKLQELAMFPLTYPHVLGQDVAGEVVEVGNSVSRFSKGDRILGHAVGLSSKRACDGAFQEYTVLMTNMASPIPDNLSFDRAVVLPLCLSTAACGMFQKEYLELQYPSATPKPTGKSLLVWGGASSVGSNAIQLAIAAGYEVITTASPKNFEYVKKLGASQVFDYNSKTIVEDLVDAFEGKTTAGALDVIGVGGAFESCVAVVDRTEGDKFVSTVKHSPRSASATVKVKFIFGDTLRNNEVSGIIYENFLPKALAEGKYIAAPEPLVVGNGLQFVQAGLEAYKKGMSAQKIVVTL